ncbi:MAG: DUF4126 family protein [Actinomycetota bacterium]|nr:DUF4126 family protein [Actinomycetota bacterium]
MLRPERRGELDLPAGILTTVGLAAIAGIRSMAAPALLARAIRRGDVRGLAGTPFAVLGSGRTPVLLQALMIGEMAGDKTPFIPARTSAPALLVRALSGALVGAALSTSDRRSGPAGALVGASSALAGTYAIDRLRSGATQGLGVPDTIFALLEDGLVLAVGTRLLRRDG